MEEHLFNPQYLHKFPVPPRKKGAPISNEHKKFALSIQVAFEKATMALATKLKNYTNAEKLCLAGGCALNCVATGKLWDSALYSDIYLPPVCSDAGGAIGSAYYIASQTGKTPSPMHTAFLGSEHTPAEIKKWADLLKVKCLEIADPAADAAIEIIKGKLVGWHQGRSEYGPRALGNRSILADPCNQGTKNNINKYVKFRETFRPFAPSVTQQDSINYFINSHASPFMNFVLKVRDTAILPAITHVDGTARVQTVSQTEDNKIYYSLLKEIEKLNGHPVVLNTSFNINGQPIVNTPQEAIYTFFASGLDTLYVGPFKFSKQP